MLKPQLYTRRKLDLSHWDSLVTRAVNGLPYAYSWYLDATTDGRWQALISTDGSVFMPIPFARPLFGLRQILERSTSWSSWVLQPLFCQQLGLFAERPLQKSETKAFLHAFFLQCPNIATYCFNENNEISENFLSRPHKMRNNYLLNLNLPYEKLFKAYSSSHRRALKKSKNRLFYEKSQTFSTTFFERHARYLGKKTGLNKRAYRRWIKLAQILTDKKLGFFISIRDEQKKLCAEAFVLYSHGRLIYQGGYSLPEKQGLHPMHALLDGLIRQYAGQNRVLDFEGSDLPGVAEFFRRFGAEQKSYCCIFSQ